MIRWPLHALLAVVLVTACAKPPPEPLPLPREVLRYVLEPGDVLNVQVFNTEELTQEVPIRPDGRISFAPLGELEAAGLTIEALDANITEGLQAYFNDPQVTVFLRKFANENVYVGGEVREPGIVALRGERMTSVMAVFDAGGFKDSARLTQVLVLRDRGEGVSDTIVLDVKRVLNGATPDLLLQPYDVVFVPKSRIAKVNLFVEQYIKRVLPFSLVASANYTVVNDPRGAAVITP